MSLRLLIEATIGGTLYRLSDENIYDLTNRWYGLVADFSGVNWRLTTRHGGYAQYSVGNLSIRQNLWASSPPAWPPAQTIGLDIYYTLSTEAAKVLIISGTGYRTEVDGQNVTYAVYPANDGVQVLDEAYIAANVTTLEINDGTATNPVYAWTLSGSGTTEYYCTLAGGGDPGISEPDRFFSGAVELTRGTAGSLANLTWDWADNDALGFSTVYLRFSGLDPDILTRGLLHADYGTVATAVPRAFGYVSNRPLTELPAYRTSDPAGGVGVYHAAGIAGTGAKQISNITNAGGGYTTITSTAHGFSNGNSVIIEIDRGNYYNGTYVVSSVAANTFNILRDYSAPTATTGIAYKAGYWCIYEDGNPYIGTAVLSLGVFTLTPRPTGIITVSGTGADIAGTTPIYNLGQVNAYVAARLGISSDVTDERAIPVLISHWEDKQSAIRDWYGKMLGYATHVAWESGGTLYLRELFYVPGAGSTAFTEFDVLEDIRYLDENKPLGVISATVKKSDWTQDSDIEITFTHSESGYYFAENVEVDAFNINANAVALELSNIAEAIKRRNVRMDVAETFFSSLPDPADRYYMAYDTFTIQDSLIHGNTIALEFDFDRDLITIIVKQILSTI